MQTIIHFKEYFSANCVEDRIVINTDYDSAMRYFNYYHRNAVILFVHFKKA